MPRQTSIQLTGSTERQVEALKRAGFGSQTDIIRLAVDRMFREEYKIAPIAVGDKYAFDDSNEDKSQFVMQGAHDCARGWFEVLSLQGEDATIHCQIDRWDNREPERVSTIDRTFDWPLVGIELVGGYRWTKQ